MTSEKMKVLEENDNDLSIRKLATPITKLDGFPQH